MPSAAAGATTASAANGGSSGRSYAGLGGVQIAPGRVTMECEVRRPGGCTDDGDAPQAAIPPKLVGGVEFVTRWHGISGE